MIKAEIQKSKMIIRTRIQKEQGDESETPLKDVNKVKPVWVQDISEITDEEYQEICKNDYIWFR